MFPKDMQDVLDYCMHGDDGFNGALKALISSRLSDFDNWKEKKQLNLEKDIEESSILHDWVTIRLGGNPPL